MPFRSGICFGRLALFSAMFVISISGCQGLNQAGLFGQPAALHATIAAPTPTSSPTLVVNSSPSIALFDPPATSTPIPSPTATLQPAPTETTSSATEYSSTFCKETHGTVNTFPLDAQSPGMSEFTLYLPPCYSSNPDTRYPVLYFLHGMNNDDHQWVHIGAPAAADRLILAGQVRPFMIVMPKEDDTTQDPDQSSFEDILVNRLVPWIDQNYATCTSSSCRAIGGLSRGSGWAIRIGLTHWSMFGSIGAHSVSPFDGDIDHLDEWIHQSTEADHPRVYLDIGILDQALPDAKAVEQVFSENHVPYQWNLFPGGHNEDYWSAHILDYLSWYASAWR